MQIILVLSVESAVANVSGVIGNGCGGVRVTVVLVRWRMVTAVTTTNQNDRWCWRWWCDVYSGRGLEATAVKPMLMKRRTLVVCAAFDPTVRV